MNEPASDNPSSASTPAEGDQPPVQVELYSDVVCPWCYIGKRKFETALADPEAPPTTVRRMPFQLEPDAPVPGGPAREAYAKKFGGAAQAEAIFQRVTDAAASVGLTFHLDRAVRANTFDAHRLLWWAGNRDLDVQAALDESIMAAYFTEGLDVSDHEVLLARVDAVDLPADEAREVLASGTYGRDVTDAIAGAASAGITAVPTFVLDRGLAIPGAQDPDVFVAQLRRVAGSRPLD